MGTDKELVLTRVIDVPREKLWRCWTEPKLMVSANLTRLSAPSRTALENNEVIAIDQVAGDSLRVFLEGW